MEKIKQALDRARSDSISSNSRNNIKRESKVLQSPEKVSSITNITYTKTKSVDTSKDILRNKKVIASNTNDTISDQYKVLRTQVLQSLKKNQWNSLIITSPNEGSGKTLTSINLAISLAREVNHTVLLVDLDLRRPSIQQYFFLQEQMGISDYLTDNVELSKILFNPSLERLVILPGNKSFNNSSEMLSSPKMVKLVEEVKSRYPNRIVIFDMPPVLYCDDVIAFSPYIDAIMLVVEEGKTRKDELEKTNRLLANKNIIGTVLNKSKYIEYPNGGY